MPKILENPYENILECAREIMQADGYNAMNIRMISKKCNISVGTVYNYFPDKASLMLALLEDYWHGYIDELLKIQSGPGDLFHRLKLAYHCFDQFFTIFLDMIPAVSDHFRDPHKGTDGEVRRKQFSLKLAGQFAELIRISALNKEIQPVLDCEDIGAYIMASFVSMSQMKDMPYDTFERILKRLILPS